MFQFEWPLALLMLPLPALIYFALPTLAQQQQAALRVPALDDFQFGASERAPIRPRRWRQWISLLAWLLLVLAASRPQWLGEVVEIPVSGRDLMLAVDLSDSMRTADFMLEGEQVDRLRATKRVASKFIERRRGDRLGLILFGSQAYLQTPLTFDSKTVNRLLREAVIGLAGERTAIGDAIGLAIKRLDPKAGNSRVLILMTDGANTAGEVTPLKAAQLAAERGLRIYTIGIGADEQIESTWFGLRRVNPSAQLDEKTLREIARISGGQYFRARDSEELEKIYLELDELEPLPRDQQNLRPINALFVWPLALALLLALLLVAPRLWRRL
ncbi:MAG: VWA domain-containing protein [Gammaproteobacteria bacterium]|nr:MAG: VWA domain-containing protein [Gammaproteobacteria bacterium]UCH39635.1 MAG: VWA domain-containing protein [Gammaproteobacteria bacterium]